jgi:hypothetical protein
MYWLAALVIVSFVAFGSTAKAWDGTDVESGTQVEIERGNLVRSGRDVDIYDYETGQYHDITIDDINRSGGSVEIQGHDNTTGEDRTFEFDDR